MAFRFCPRCAEPMTIIAFVHREGLNSAQPHTQVREDVEDGGLETELPQVLQINSVNDHR